MSNTKTCAQESAVCCCVDFGTVIDNDDCTVQYEQIFVTQAEAQAMLAQLTEKARAIESDPCQISEHFESVEEGVKLQVTLVFACATERMIFQLKMR